MPRTTARLRFVYESVLAAAILIALPGRPATMLASMAGNGFSNKTSNGPDSRLAFARGFARVMHLKLVGRTCAGGTTAFSTEQLACQAALILRRALYSVRTDRTSHYLSFLRKNRLSRLFRRALSAASYFFQTVFHYFVSYCVARAVLLGLPAQRLFVAAGSMRWQGESHLSNFACIRIWPLSGTAVASF